MNILCIFADQMHKFAMNCMGTTDIHTPNLDRLASEGVLFTRAYTNSPICTPFRIHLMTGLLSSQTNTMNNEDRIPEWCTTLPVQFNEAGYTTSYVGKWHVGGSGNGPVPQELRAGFQRFLGYQCYNSFHRDVCFYDEHAGEHRFDYHRTDVTGDLALQRLDEIKQDPFLQYVCFQSPHYPVQPAERYDNLYRDRTIRKRPNYVKGVEPFTPTFSPPSPEEWDEDPDYREYGGNMEKYIRKYYAMVSQIDFQVGRIIDYLVQNSLWENTAVFFMSDHGDMQGSHGCINKCLPWEESSGIPFIARIPGGLRGHICHEPVSGIDTYPTFLELASITNRVSVSGTSFVPALVNEESDERTAISEGVIPVSGEEWMMVCSRDMKLVVDTRSRQPTMLFNLEIDPFELDNLVEDESMAEVIADMMNRLPGYPPGE